jgi:hypothetical protein
MLDRIPKGTPETIMAELFVRRSHPTMHILAIILLAILTVALTLLATHRTAAHSTWNRFGAQRHAVPVVAYA